MESFEDITVHKTKAQNTREKKKKQAHEGPLVTTKQCANGQPLLQEPPVIGGAAIRQGWPVNENRALDTGPSPIR